MNEPKPFASLSSGLLARKGAAKPAMRPQSFGSLGGGLEDLGWNDMGSSSPAPAFDDEPREHVPSSISALTPAPRSTETSREAAPAEDGPEFPLDSPVVEQQRAIAASFPVANEPDFDDAADLGEPAPVVQLPRRPRQAPGSKAKAAFTLRLDPQRHLKLRLACAVRHKSAQQIVSQALDEFLKSLPELDSLAQQLPAQAGKRN